MSKFDTTIQITEQTNTNKGCWGNKQKNQFNLIQRIASFTGVLGDVHESQCWSAGEAVRGQPGQYPQCLYIPERVPIIPKHTKPANNKWLNIQEPIYSTSNMYI